MAGRPPKNFKLHLLEKGKTGIYGDLKNREDAEPEQKSDETPQCPREFSKREKEIWHKYAHILEEYSLFNLANGPILELLTKNLRDREKCLDIVKKEGICVDSYRGRVYNAYWMAKNRCEENILKHLNLLGLSSLGLARLGCLSSKKKKKSEMEGLLDD